MHPDPAQSSLLHLLCTESASISSSALRQPSSAPNPLAACCAEPTLLACLHSVPAS
ncbi:hypothetical protein SLEP1_g26220 [Rubroshorea leprosula]|uniref:Uncharacterized protein n=1 Tax=Rubroshorea leprosula TaxID=152421 RepID=A0AAV5JLH1_9ROSI|nr:hypothetical protein SLEP1_g26220 [Rubroshorea leprosula]